MIAFPQSSDFAKSIVNSVNADTKPTQPFDLLASVGPANGSLARACTEKLDTQSFILETTFKDQSMSLRTRQHRQMVSTAMRRIGMLQSDCVNVLSPARTNGITRVALFDDAGANEAAVLKVLDQRSELFVCHVGPLDLNPEVFRRDGGSSW